MVYSGKTGYVQIGSILYCFDEWSVDIDGELPDMSAFCSGGGHTRVDGVTDNIINLSGPYDVGGMALVRGQQYAFTLGIAAGVSMTITARVKTISINNKYMDGPRIKVQALASNAPAGFVIAIT